MDHVSPLIYTKVRIPASRRLVPRPRLLNFLHENIHRRLLLVCAGPGYGKTSLLVDFARSTDLPVCWYTLDALDRDPLLFLDYLIESVRVHFPSFGERARALLRTGHASDLHGLVGVLANELLEEIREYIVIVLDEYQVVESEESVNQCLDLLLQHLPENVHLVIVGRTIPAVSIIRLTARGEVTGIGSESLRFTKEEVQELFRRHLDLQPAEEEVERLTRENEGWITGILLGMQALWQGLGFVAQARDSEARVYAYMASEVFRHLSPPVRQFLEKTSLLTQMDAALCDALLERNDSAEMLQLLDRQNLFLVPLEGNWYRFHGLFREFLLQEVQADRAEYSRLNRRAAQLWRERGEHSEAVEHLLQAQAYEEAACEIEALAQELFLRGRLSTLARWIEALPEVTRQHNPRLLRFLGKAYMATDQGEKARATFQEARQLLVHGGDVQDRVQTIAELSTLERLQGNYEQAWQIAQEGLSHSQGLSIPALVDLHRTMGVCLYYKGNLARAEEHLTTAVEYGLSTGLAYNQALAYQDLGVCLRAQGRMKEAEEAYRQSLERWRVLENPGPLANILNNLAMGPFLRGDLQQAQDLLSEASEAAQRSLSPRLQALVQASLGDLYLTLGDLGAARQIYRQGLENAQRADSMELCVYLREALGNLARHEGKYSEAQQCFQEAQETANLPPKDWARLQVSLSFLAAAKGSPSEAIELLEQLLGELEREGERLQLLRAHLAYTIAHLYLGRTDKAKEALQDAVTLASEMAVLEPFLLEGKGILPMLQELATGPQGRFLEPVIKHLQAQPSTDDQPPCTAAQPVLRVFALGPGRVVWNQEISVKDWVARQTRELFLYLFFHTPARKEQIALALWPDRDRSQVTSTFHATLYRARQAIGAPFVIFQDDVYLWNPEIPRWCDAEEVEQLLDQAKGHADPGEATGLLEKAVSLCGGDFLEDFDGEWCIVRREELREKHLQALLQLGHMHQEQSNFRSAQEAYTKALQLDSFCEEAYRGLMRCHAMAGERARAAQVYRQCRHHLLQELQVSPSEATQTLYQAIVRGEPLP